MNRQVFVIVATASVSTKTALRGLVCAGLPLRQRVFMVCPCAQKMFWQAVAPSPPRMAEATAMMIFRSFCQPCSLILLIALLLLRFHNSLFSLTFRQGRRSRARGSGRPLAPVSRASLLVLVPGRRLHHVVKRQLHHLASVHQRAHSRSVLAHLELRLEQHADVLQVLRHTEALCRGAS